MVCCGVDGWMIKCVQQAVNGMVVRTGFGLAAVLLPLLVVRPVLVRWC